MPDLPRQRLTPEIFCALEPLTNLEREEIWRRKKWGHKLVDWWAITHPEDDGITAEDILGDMPNLPPYLRRQAS